MQTIKVIHEPAAEPLHVSLFKLGVLAFAFIVILLIIGFSGSGALASYSHAIELQQSAMKDMPVEAGVLSDLLMLLRTAWDSFWILVRVLFWLAIGLAGVAVVLAMLAGLGILTWIGKQIAKGMAWLVTLVKQAWSGDAKPSSEWTTEAAIADLDKRVEVLERVKNG